MLAVEAKAKQNLVSVLHTLVTNYKTHHDPRDNLTTGDVWARKIKGFITGAGQGGGRGRDYVVRKSNSQKSDPDRRR